MRPVWDRILVERPLMKKVGSIHIPHSAQAKHAKPEGIITAIGERCDGPWEVGQRVIFGRYAGGKIEGADDDDWIKDGDRELLVIQETDVLAIVEEPHV